MQRVNNLFEKIISTENLSLAIDSVNRTHRWHKAHRPNFKTAWVEVTKEERIEELQQLLLTGWTPTPPKIVVRYDTNAGKERIIHMPIQWPDQYIHHALIQVLSPIVMPQMDYYCCGSIPNRGGKRVYTSISKWMKEDIEYTQWCLQCDIRHFYDSLNPQMVMNRMHELIKDASTMHLIWDCISTGIDIGTYTSQWFANTVIAPLDQAIRQSGLCRYYVRYMDNFTIFSNSKEDLHKLKDFISSWLAAHELELKNDWQIFNTGERAPVAVGYKYNRKYRLPRKKNLLKMKRKIKACKKASPVTAARAKSLLALLGPLQHCNNANLYLRLFKGERFISKLKRAVRAQRQYLLDWSYVVLHMTVKLYWPRLAERTKLWFKKGAR